MRRRGNNKCGGGLIGCDCFVVVINHDFDSGGVHEQGFTERTRFSHEHPAALAQGAIDRFDDAGFAAPFRRGKVAARW